MCCTSTFSLSYCIECVCAEEGSEEKIDKEHLPLILHLAHCLCLPLNVGVVRKYERKRLSLYMIPTHLHLPSVYILYI